MSPPDDGEDRAAILRRRAMFVVSAVAGIGLVACGDEPSPRTCLNIAEPEKSVERPQPCLATAGPDASAPPPQPCLDVAPVDTSPPADAGTPDASAAAPDAGAADAGTPPPVPSPCLRVAPKPCLKMARPKP